MHQLPCYVKYSLILTLTKVIASRHFKFKNETRQNNLTIPERGHIFQHCKTVIQKSANDRLIKFQSGCLQNVVMHLITTKNLDRAWSQKQERNWSHKMYKVMEPFVCFLKPKNPTQSSRAGSVCKWGFHKKKKIGTVIVPQDTSKKNPLSPQNNNVLSMKTLLPVQHLTPNQEKPPPSIENNNVLPTKMLPPIPESPPKLPKSKVFKLGLTLPKPLTLEEFQDKFSMHQKKYNDKAEEEGIPWCDIIYAPDYGHCLCCCLKNITISQLQLWKNPTNSFLYYFCYR